DTYSTLMAGGFCNHSPKTTNVILIQRHGSEQFTIIVPITLNKREQVFQLLGLLGISGDPWLFSIPEICLLAVAAPFIPEIISGVF
ncbi:hypothetical protein ACJX0J_034213, partial [Zea mays]